MGWQGDHDSGPGDVPGPGDGLPGLPGLLAGFEHGGAWDAAGPSAGLAAALEAASGPLGRYDGAGTGALVGIVRQWAAVESWAASGMFAALRAMMREDGEGRPLLRRRSDLPQGWDDSLNYEIAGALAMGPVSAGNLAGLAWTLGARLPGIGRLLADGTLTKAKAKLIAQTFGPLSEEEAARAEALIVSGLAGRTYFQVERLAWRAALAVAPDVAERRRSAAERERARVTVFREESGAVGLSGRDLPAAQALSGHASVLARAGQYEASGAFPGQAAGALQALAYLHLLNGVTAQDAIAFARAATAQPPGGTGQDDDDGNDPDGNDPDGNGGDTGGGSGPGGGDSPGGCALPARINITVTEALLRQLAAQAAQPARPTAAPAPAPAITVTTTVTTRTTVTTTTTVTARDLAATVLTGTVLTGTAGIRAAAAAGAGQAAGRCCRR